MKENQQGFVHTPDPVATEVTESVEDVLRAMLGLDETASYKEIIKAAKKAGKKNGTGQQTAVD